MNRVFLALVVAAGCHSSTTTSPDAGENDLATATDMATVAPLVAPSGQWTWFDLPGNVCNDGSQTGMGVYPGTEPDKLIVYFEGGGACGDYVSCEQAHTATSGPFGKSEFEARLTIVPGSELDSTDTSNPFQSYTKVYIPYCTGDVHSGVRVVTYSGSGGSTMYHHVGHTNAMTALDKIVATWPTLTKLVVSGASAGGYGASINYDSYRKRWPSAEGYMLDDSGPLLESANTTQELKNWYTSWGLFDWITTFCADCTTEPSKLYPALGAAWPHDRLALLESLQDSVIRGFYGYTSNPEGFEAALLKLTSDYIDPISNFKRFFITGDTHTMVGSPSDFSSNGVQLWTWLQQLVSDDSAWTTQTPM